MRDRQGIDESKQSGETRHEGQLLMLGMVDAL